jgi:hypothetical protein
MKVVTIQEFLRPFPDFHTWEGKRQVDYLAYYLQKDDMGGRIWYVAGDIDDLYTEIPLNPYQRTARYLSEESLKRKGGSYVRRPSGYVLSKHRFDEIESTLMQNPRKIAVSSALASLKRKIKSTGEKIFLAETIACHEIGSNRAAVVMMWTLVIAHLRNAILAKYSTQLNAQIGLWNQTHPKNQIGQINVYDDFGEIPDHRFIELAKSSGAINKDQKHILEEKLKIRNMAGHPTSATIAPSKVDEFIDDLALNFLVK